MCRCLIFWLLTQKLHEIRIYATVNTDFGDRERLVLLGEDNLTKHQTHRKLAPPGEGRTTHAYFDLTSSPDMIIQGI
jgi:hypothetical protein